MKFNGALLSIFTAVLVCNHPRAQAQILPAGAGSLQAIPAESAQNQSAHTQLAQTVITIDQQRGTVTQTSARPACEATISEPAPLTDANYDNYRLSGTCTKNTFLSISPVNDPDASPLRPDAPCKDGVFTTRAIGSFDHLDPRKLTKLEVAINGSRGQCDAIATIPVKLTAYKNAAARPVAIPPTPAVAPELTTAIHAFVDANPKLTKKVMGEIATFYTAVSTDWKFRLRISTAEVRCIYRAVDLEALQRADLAHAYATFSDAAWANDATRHVQTPAGGEPRKELNAVLDYIKALDSGVSFKDYYKGSTPRALTPDERESQKRIREERNAFLTTQAGKALDQFNTVLAPWYERAAKVYLFQAFEKCGANYSKVYGR